MPKYGNILLSLLILAAIAVSAYRGADALQYSLFTYQSPMSVIEIAPGEKTPPLTERVIVVIIGGLSYDSVRSLDMPNLETLLAAGASALMISQPPTYPVPAWTTLLTGAWPEINNAPILESTTNGLRPIGFDHLFVAAHDAGLLTAFAGFEGWRELLSAEKLGKGIYTSSEDTVSDGQVAQAVLSLVTDPEFDLILVYFGQVDALGRVEGVGSPAYAGAARQVDNYLRQIIRLLDSSRSVLIVTSDHGLMEDGRLGGSESELTSLPFVMIGQNIIPGLYSPVRQTDLAPTVAALLGTRVPVLAQGRTLYEMLRIDEETHTWGQLRMAAQKVTLGDAYLQVMGEDGLSQAIHRDLDSAQQALVDGNQAGALELGRLIADEANAEMASARAVRVVEERLLRLTGVIAGLILSTIFFWWRRGPHTLLSLTGGGVAAGTYYGLYWLGGYTFSISSVGAVDEYFATLVRFAAFGMLGGGLWLLLGLLYRDERRWSELIIACYDYGLFAAFLSALPALVAYWQHGATIRWYIPELGLTLLHFAALVDMGIVALLGIPLPWLVAGLVWGLGRWRTHVETRVQVWDPIARLRRR